MAQDLPDALRLREIKYGLKSTDEDRIRWAERLLEAGRVAEALDLYLLAGEEMGVSRLTRQAIDEGRVHLLLHLRRAGREPTRDDWKAAGDGALNAQRWRDAYRAYSEAGHEPGLERVGEQLPDGYELYSPQGK